MHAEDRVDDPFTSRSRGLYVWVIPVARLSNVSIKNCS